MISIKYGISKDIDSWMRLVQKVSRSFPGLETEEALIEHHQTVLEFMSRRKRSAQNRMAISLACSCFQKKTICFAFWRLTQFSADSISQRKCFALCFRRCMGDKPITVTTYREGVPEGIAAGAFYERIGFTEGKLTEEFGSPVQEFVWKAVGTLTGKESCPCKKTKCERHGNCDACRAYHTGSKRKRPCERTKNSWT